MKEQGLEARVRATAKDGRYNLRQYADKRQHKEICKKIVQVSDDFKDENGKPFPICYIVYFMVGKNAHRLPVFEAGYTKCDEKKARRIISWALAFAKKMGNPKLARNDRVLHALTKYYERVGNKTSDFTDKIKTLSPQPKFNDFKEIAAFLGISS